MIVLEKVEVEPTTIKIVRNKGSINVIANKSSYYAKGISRRRKLIGKTYVY